MSAIFHLAYPVHDLDAARRFYTGVLGCQEGRSAPTWVDFDFFGHQLSLHLGERQCAAPIGRVEEMMVPIPHFGVVLPMPQWQAVAAAVVAAGVEMLIAPTLRFVGAAGEQATLFFLDPSGNAIEIKGFTNLDKVYAQ